MADDLAPGTPDPGSAPTESPAFLDLKEDSLIKAPGMEKPVAYKDFLSGYVSKADLTRMRQQDAENTRRREDALKQQEAQLQRTAQQLTQRLGPQTNPQDAIYQQLEAVPFLDGKQAATMLRSIVAEIQKRDQAQTLLQQEIASLKQGFGSLNGESRKSAQQALYGEALKASGLLDNEHVRGLVEETYFAHDGWDTVSREEQIAELARLTKQRFTGIESAIRAADKQKVENARRPAPTTPQAPGVRRQAPNGAGHGTPEQIAKKLFASFPHNAPDS